MGFPPLLLMLALAAEPAEPAPASPPETAEPPTPARPGAAGLDRADRPGHPGPLRAPACHQDPSVTSAKELLTGIDATFRPYLLGQVWFFLDCSAPSGCTTAGCLATSSTFRIRRAEMGLQGGAFSNRLLYKVTIDPARALELQNTTLAVAGSKTETVSAKQPIISTAALDSPSTALTVLNDMTLTYAFDPLLRLPSASSASR